MKIEVEDGGIILSDVFSGIGIKTDAGMFGIAQRDGGIEVLRDGKLVWASEHDVHETTLEGSRSGGTSTSRNSEYLAGKREELRVALSELLEVAIDAIILSRRALGMPER